MKHASAHKSTVAIPAMILLCAGVLAEPAPAAASAYAYVGNQVSGTVSVIDTSSDAVVRTLPDHGKIGRKIQAVVAARDQRHIFVVDAHGNDLVDIDTASGKIVKRIPVGRAPEGASLSPSGKTIAVCVEQDNQVVLVDVATAAVTHVIRTQGKNPEHCVFSRDEKWLMTGNENSDDADIIDLAKDRSVGLVHTTGRSRGVAWLPGDRIAYVAEESSNGVDIIDVPGRRVRTLIPTGLRAADTIATQDGKMVFVSNGGAGTISAIDTATEKVIATIPVGMRPWNMALTHDGKKLYVANGHTNNVSVIDTAKFTVIKTIPVGRLPWGVDIP